MTPAENHRPIRVALVEDEMLFQRAFRDAIDSADDMVLLYVAGTVSQAMANLEREAVDVLLVDLGLPDGSGIDIIKAARQSWPSCDIMVSTTFGDEQHVMQSIQAGALGYLLKDSAAMAILAEIRSLHHGGSPISPVIARRILSRFQEAGLAAIPSASDDKAAAQDSSVESDRDSEVPPILSARESQALSYITKGFTVNEIAGLMQISPHTVQTFVRRIYSKLEVSSRVEAIQEARSRGLIAQ